MERLDESAPELASSPARHRDASVPNPGGFAHVPALDGIRGLAILMVLANHLLSSNPQTGNWFYNLISEIPQSAWCGVSLFFALSGFLITGILLDTLHVKKFFSVFYARRTLRIFPLYYGFLILMLLLTRPFHLNWYGWQPYYLTYTANLALWRLPHFPSLTPFNINHFWSLQVEEQFYLVWPFVVFRVRRPGSLAKVALGGALLIFAIRVVLVSLQGHPLFSYVYLVYKPTYSNADSILFGCGLSALLRTRWRDKVLQLAPRALCIGLALVTIIFFWLHGLHWERSRLMQTFGFSLLGLTSAALVASSLNGGSIPQRLFEWRTLRFFGTYSYGLYVYHNSIDGICSAYLRAFLLVHLHSKAAAVSIAALIVCLLSILVALLSYHLVEVHLLKLKRYFSYKKPRDLVTS